jgi:nucleotidyltransferase/DNA polymerase involved in DNA repair
VSGNYNKYDFLLCDLDAFFASVEQLDHPELQGKPIIVGGNSNARGVVSTCSYEARKYGVRSAMPMRRAIKLCPDAVILPVNMRRYREVSQQVLEIFEQFTPDIEPVSIDEAYLAFKAGTGYKTAEMIRNAVREELKLPISIGISVNKLLSKIACEMAKPDNFKALWPGDVPRILWPLRVKVIPGIGPATEKKLELYSIKTVEDLAKFSLDALINILGKNAIILQNYANGYDDREIELVHKVKSISEETTFSQDVFDREFILATLLVLSEGIGYRLRSKGLQAKTISLKLRFADFSTITRDMTLSEVTDGDMDIYRSIEELFNRYSGKPPWRLVGVRVSGFESFKQISLLSPDPQKEKEQRVVWVKDKLRDKFGRDVVYSAKRLVLKQPEIPED